MSNDAVQDFSVAVNNLVQTAGTFAQQSYELVNIGFKAVAGLVEPLFKTTCDLVCKAPATVTPVTSVKPVTPVFQGSSVNTPKK
jgi:hypothetical protein